MPEMALMLLGLICLLVFLAGIDPAGR